MLEKIYHYKTVEEKTVEILVEDDPVQLNHIVLTRGDALPEHYSNSNVYLTIVRGRMTLQLDDQDAHIYTRGNIVNVPFHTKMNVGNQNDEILEFFVVKAPHPKKYSA